MKDIIEQNRTEYPSSNFYIFHGTTSVLKEKSLDFLSNFFGEDTDKDNLTNHPDFKLIEPEDSSEIKIEQVRALKSFLNTSPFIADYKAALIYPADKLNIESQNALLKLLEEPSESVILLLAASSIDRLLDTILSRGSLVYLGSHHFEKNDFEKNSLNFWNELENISNSARIKSIESIDSKEKAVDFLNAGLFALLEKAKQKPSRTIVNILKNICETKDNIERRNANIKLSLLNLLIF